MIKLKMDYYSLSLAEVDYFVSEIIIEINKISHCNPNIATEWKAWYKPPQDFNLILQGVLFPLERLLVDDLHRHQLARAFSAFGQPHFRESTTANPEIRNF